MDKLKAMSYFCAIAETGSFSRAARKMGVPVSSLSRSTQGLEAELGAELLKRSTRHVTLTEIGALYLVHCQNILRSVDQAEGLVNSYQSKPSGVLRISAMALYFELRIMPLLEEFQQQYPEIILDMDLSSEVMDMNRDGIDIAFRGGGLPDERIVAHYIESNSTVLCAAPSYLKEFGRPLKIEDLAQHRAIYYRTPGQIKTWGYVNGTDWRPIDVEPAFISNNDNQLLRALLGGEGLCLMPQWCVEKELSSGKVVKLELNHKLSNTVDPTLGIYLLYHRPHYMIPKVRVAVDFFKDRLAPKMYIGEEQSGSS